LLPKRKLRSSVQMPCVIRESQDDHAICNLRRDSISLPAISAISCGRRQHRNLSGTGR
jgi:hypothetical protein